MNDQSVLTVGIKFNTLVLIETIEKAYINGSPVQVFTAALHCVGS